MMDFESAFNRLIGVEGSYVNDPADPGGETKYGISKATYPQEDIPNLTLDHAKALYLRDFWGPAGCDAVPDGLKYTLFDMAVNSGVRTAVRNLQQAVGEKEDGVLGPHTLQAVQAMGPSRVMARFQGYRLYMMTDLKTWPSYGKGWAKRVARDLMGA
jgi:lysozyme family protein